MQTTAITDPIKLNFKDDEQIIEQLEQRLLKRVKLQYASIVLEQIDSQRV